MKSIILLSGPVGAGKTTVALELVKNAPGPTVHIEGDKFWFFIAKNDPGGRKKDFRTIMASMTAAAIPYALADYEVILDFSIPPWFLETVLKMLSRREVPLEYVVLRPSLGVCSARASARQEGSIKDYQQYAEFYKDFKGVDGHVISNDSMSATDVAAQIRNGIAEGLFRLASAPK